MLTQISGIGKRRVQNSGQSEEVTSLPCDWRERSDPEGLWTAVGV